MQRSKSSKRWLKQHFDDFYVKKAHTEGYRSRAVYKLQEIDSKELLFRPGLTVIDLGAAPGGWTQYVAEKIDGQGTIIALDILPMDALPGVDFIHGDFTDDLVLQQLIARVPWQSVDIIISDMAPNLSGNRAIDIPRAMYLTELAFDLCAKMLKPGGVLLMKVFHGTGFEELLHQVRLKFTRVTIQKPRASRSSSRETYLLAKGYNL